MALDRPKVIFRRIRGRIVPIKLSKRQILAIEGSALTGAGIFGAVKLGKVSGQVQRAAVSSRQLAFNFGTGRAGISAIEGLMPGSRAFGRSEKLATFSRKIGGFGRITSAAAIGLGIEKLIGASGIEQTGLAPEFFSELAGVSGATFVALGAEKGLTGKRIRTQLLEKFREQAPTFRTKAIQAVKQFTIAAARKKLKI